MRTLSLAIVGIPYPNKRGPSRIFEVNLCKPGEPVELVPEPKNPADENAIAIYSCRGVQLGYVTAERAPLILSFLRSGREAKAVFQGVAETGAWIRVAFDGEEPRVAPQPRTIRYVDPASQVRHDDGFWPDPEYDE